MFMKYNVGDILFVKKCQWKYRLRLHLRLHPLLRPLLHNTVGIITEVHKHSDIFRSGSTENDNLYIWLSQVDRKEYHFFENEIECEVLK
jgi:hypothetical protein